MAGKILKIKLGYNPNSSSIGSLFSAFLWVAASGSFLMAAFSELRPPKPGDSIPPSTPSDQGEH
jgi:hypothetical protein